MTASSFFEKEHVRAFASTDEYVGSRGMSFRDVRRDESRDAAALVRVVGPPIAIGASGSNGYAAVVSFAFSA